MENLSKQSNEINEKPSSGDSSKLMDALKSDTGESSKLMDSLKNDTGNSSELMKALDTEKPEKKGGSYAEVKENSDGSTHEVHHMPADSASDLSREDGPAIKMEKEDHRQTASCGNSKEAQEYRQKQKEMIEQGEFREAFDMDVDDLREKFGDKYDDAIAEAEEYVTKLEEEGNV